MYKPITIQLKQEEKDQCDELKIIKGITQIAIFRRGLKLYLEENTVDESNKSIDL